MIALAALFAASCSLSALDGDVRVGHAGAWRKPAPGARLSEDEVVSIGLGAHATVALPDGSTRVLTGRTVVPVKRLLDRDSSRVLLSEAVRKQTFASFSDDSETTAHAARGLAMGAESIASRRSHTVTFMGEDEERERVSTGAADMAESRMRLADPAGAIDFAWLVIADPDASPLDRLRAHVVLGRVAVDDALPETGLLEFEMALSGAPPTGPHSSDTRGAALLQRGQARMQLGDDEAAVADFEEIIRLAPKGADAAHAEFFLGAIALSRSQNDLAKKRFAALAGFPELSRSAAELMRGAD